ncbi:hypothetical protein Dsin_027451 [Dipteronia sinensis]|uniref:protein-serine/threonine phosphatase n=1 Tax=Dipteronia sinensis TaxID=43782 RepID=A0AAD9ZNS1_9ROSI|nr:hypothetical protein Dsin_027451 [Dipteronia sinensis]
MIVSQKMVAEAEIMCKQSIPSTTTTAAAAAAAAALDVKYHVCVAKEQNFQIDVNVKNGSSPSTPVFREVRVTESVSADISRLESVVSCCSESIKSAVVESSPVKFVPSIRSGSYADIGTRDSMEDEHIQIDDLSAHFGSLFKCPTPSAFYAVFDGHGGPEAAAYIKKNAMKLFFEDAELPETSAIDKAFLQELENSHRKAFLLADLALADEHSVSCTCGTTALTALVLGSHLLVANAGDCRAVLCRKGVAFEMSQDHRPSYLPERMRVEELGGYIDDVYLRYLDGSLSITRALGDWEMKFPIGSASPLIAEPDVKQEVLTKDDEFLIIGCDGIWDVMSSQYAISLVRRELRRHNDPQQSAQKLVKEALRLSSSDNVTVIVICLSSDPPESCPPQGRRFRCTDEAGSMLNSLLEGK